MHPLQVVYIQFVSVIMERTQDQAWGIDCINSTCMMLQYSILVYVYGTTVLPRSDAVAINYFTWLELAVTIRGECLLEGGVNKLQCWQHNYKE